MKILEVDNSNLLVLNNLAQAYEAEFSQITKKNPRPDGLYPLDTKIDQEHPGYLLFDSKIPIGFCIKGSQGDRSDIAEFYIIPTYRAKSIGQQFAIDIFKMYPGKWQVRQIEGADKAVKFWRKIIAFYTDGNFHETTQIDPYWGKITCQTFVSP